MLISSWLENVRRHKIIDPVRNDPRNSDRPGTILGAPVPWIFQNLVDGGQADFDMPLLEFSSRDRVLLYAYLLQKGHVAELTHAFARLLAEPHHLNGATVVDIGCGPFTAGLALANVAGPESYFRYFGVDTSSSMRKLGAELVDAARLQGALSEKTAVDFVDSVDSIDFGSMRVGWTVVILSYLLASKTINVDFLAKQIVQACARIGPGPVVLLYTNSAREEARVSFPRFKELMLQAGFEVNIEETERLEFFGKFRSIHYALFHRLAAAAISLSEFTK